MRSSVRTLNTPMLSHRWSLNYDFLNHNFFYVYCVCACTCVCEKRGSWVEVKENLQESFLSPHLWVLGSELRLSGLMARNSIISSARKYYYLYFRCVGQIINVSLREKRFTFWYSRISSLQWKFYFYATLLPVDFSKQCSFWEVYFFMPVIHESTKAAQNLRVKYSYDYTYRLPW